MSIFKCKMCGGDLRVSEDSKIAECEYCGTTQTVPNGDDEKKINLFNRANRLRMENEFDKAAGIYESIVSEYPEESEGYWGLVLCAFGIEYVDDAKTGKKIPTCHRTVTSSVMDDDNFAQACENANTTARAVYREEAKEIDRLQKKIISVVEGEEPYDVFICYKETDDVTRARTEDSLIAQDIYTELVKEGYKVFFSRVTLREKAGTEYEPYIYAALKSSKVMLAIGTKYEYYDAVWVKNEWGRYITMMAEDKEKHLIPCFKNLDAYDIPKEFKNLQALDMGEVTFFKNLAENISRFVPKKAEKGASVSGGATAVSASATEPLLKRAFMFLEDGDWNSANEYCEKVLDIDPECAEAYLGKLMINLELDTIDKFSNYRGNYSNNSNYKKILRFIDKNETLKKLFESINENKKKEKKRIEVFKKESAEAASVAKKMKKTIAITDECVYGIKSNGTVVPVCETCGNPIDIPEYRDAVALSYVDDPGIVEVLKGDGTVSFFSDFEGCGDLDHLKDVIKNEGNASLTKHGTVIGYDDCDKWENIVDISSGWDHLVGLTKNGTVVASGKNEYGCCDVAGWKNIVGIATGSYHTVGLKKDGTAIAVGLNDVGQCNVNEWGRLSEIIATNQVTIGHVMDGSVMAAGRNNEGQCNVSEWSDIICVCTSGAHTVGLKKDGTVVATGRNDEGQCNVSEWRSIVAIYVYENVTVGLMKNGEVVISGAFSDENNKCIKCKAISVKLTEDINKLDEEKALEKRKQIEADALAAEMKCKAEEHIAEVKRKEEEQIEEKERLEEERKKAYYLKNETRIVSRYNMWSMVSKLLGYVCLLGMWLVPIGFVLIFICSLGAYSLLEPSLIALILGPILILVTKGIGELMDSACTKAQKSYTELMKYKNRK